MRKDAVTLLLTVAAVGLAGSARAADAPTPADAACSTLAPSASMCVGLDKLAGAAAAECRRAGVPDDSCTLPLGSQVTGAARDAYLKTSTHRALVFQQALGDALPLTDAVFLGTHNSFNSVNDPTSTASHTDSNQQLSLSQQLDIDIRSVELDLHYIPSPSAGGASAVVVCHGRGPDEAHAGCTNERTFEEVLPEVATWLKAHPDQVILLYLEDELGDPAGFTSTVATLDKVLKGADGTPLVYRPDPAAKTSKGCTNLPLSLTRDAVRAAGAQVVIVGNCRAGWASRVFGWDDVHVESGSTPKYQAFPKCDAVYDRSVYADKLVRYYEDSTFVAQAIDPSSTPQSAQADRLTPDKVTSMVDCGVNLFGFDQLLPEDGRLDAAIWSWAPGKPDPADGLCAVQREDTRWVTTDCGTMHPAACTTSDGGALATAPVTASGAPGACAARGAVLALPRTGERNSVLRAALPGGTGDAWLAAAVAADGTAHTVPAAAAEPSVVCRPRHGAIACAIGGASPATSVRATATLRGKRAVVAKGSAGLSAGAGTVRLRSSTHHRLRKARYTITLHLGTRTVERHVRYL